MSILNGSGPCLWGSLHFNEDHDTPVSVRVYTPSEMDLLPVDELRLAYQALMDAASAVFDQMSEEASAAHALERGKPRRRAT